MVILGIGIALAGPPPEGLNLEDVDTWEQHAFALTEGPPGCWQLEGAYEVRAIMYLPDTFFQRGGQEEVASTGTFVGTIQDGAWSELVYRSAPDEEGLEDVLIRPLVGVLEEGVIRSATPAASGTDEAGEEPEPEGVEVSVNMEDGSAEAINLLRDSLDRWWDSSIRTSYMRWDSDTDAAQLVVEVPTSDRPTADVVTFTAHFPQGGLQATQLDSILPRRLRLGDGLISAKVMNGQLHLYGRVIDGLLLPTQESWGAVIGIFGFTLGFEQRIQYTAAQPCSQ